MTEGSGGGAGEGERCGWESVNGMTFHYVTVVIGRLVVPP